MTRENLVRPAWVPNHRDLFTPRQLVALTTFSDLVREAREKVLKDARVARECSVSATASTRVATDSFAYADASLLTWARCRSRLRELLVNDFLSSWQPNPELEVAPPSAGMTLP